MSADTQIIPDELRVELASPYVRRNFESGEPWSMTIARAILAERERCASVADEAAKGRGQQQDDAADHGDRRAARDFESMKFEAVEIAAAIREGA